MSPTETHSELIEVSITLGKSVFSCPRDLKAALMPCPPTESHSELIEVSITLGKSVFSCPRDLKAALKSCPH